MSPTSYQSPTAEAAPRQSSTSQSVSSNLRTGAGASIATILAEKGSVVHAVAPTSTLSDAMALMAEHRIGALLVSDPADPSGGLAGILSERDVVRHLAETGAAGHATQVAEVMTENPVSCTPQDTLLVVMKAMTDGNFRHMPVVSDGALAGLVSIRDVVRYRLMELEHDALRMKQMIVG